MSQYETTTTSPALTDPGIAGAPCGEPPVDEDHKEDQETVVLASLIQAINTGDTELRTTVLNAVEPNDFSDPARERIFTALCALAEANATVTKDSLVREAGKLASPDMTEAIEHVLAEQPTANDKQLGTTIDSMRRTTALRRTHVALQDAADDVAAAASNPQMALIGISNMLQDTVASLLRADQGARATVPDFSAELDQFVAELARTHGKEFLGLPTGTLPTLDRMTLGMRGFTLLAAAPGVGKTALGTQIGVDIVEHNSDAVFICFSFEMTRRDLTCRMLAMLSGLSWRTVLLGSKGVVKTFASEGLCLTPKDARQFKQSVDALKAIANRIVIYDIEKMPEVSHEGMLAAIRAAKKKAGVQRAFILVDSLQAMPFTRPEGTPWGSDIERDNHVITRLLALQRRTGDALMLISEQNKAGMGQAALKSPRGTARAVYSPDCVLVLQSPDKQESNAGAARVPVTLKIIKGRDGTTRGTLSLFFEHARTTFAETESDLDTSEPDTDAPADSASECDG